MGGSHMKNSGEDTTLSMGKSEEGEKRCGKKSKLSDIQDKSTG